MVRPLPYPGPAALGRSVVVSAGASPPGPWADQPRVIIDDSAVAEPIDVVAKLHRAWSGRLPLVIELGVDPRSFRQPRAVDAAVWSLDPGLELWEERLHFLTWANTYDARSGSGAPVWWWATKAARLGAEVLPPGDTGPGDVILADGRRAWIDGGPRCPFPGDALEGIGVIHRESVERGRLDIAPKPDSPVADLAADQLAAVAHHSGPARIIAPAGSGKTRVLTERFRHLLAGREWEGDAVLAVAYNKKAQEELEARTAGLAARTRTLNSLGLHLLTSSRGRAPGLIGERDARRIVEHLAPIRRRRANTDPVGPYLEALSEIRLGLVDPEIVEAGRDDVAGLAELFDPYREALAAEGAVDFDEQIYGAIEVLLRNPAFRIQTQMAHRHVLVDEFQDLTPAHVLLIRLLALPGLDVFGVGDDDQVIYGHAGADPAFLIDYERLFPGAGDHPLEVNYRCPSEVVTAATTLLGYNERRVAKTIRAAKAATAPDAPPALKLTTHPAGEGATTLVAAVRAWLDIGNSPASVAVLTRVNSLILAPHVALNEAGIAIQSVLSPDVLERTGLRAALAYLRLAAAPESAMAGGDIVEVLRRPSRGLPPWFSDRVRRRSQWSVRTLASIARSVPERDAVKVEQLVEDLQTLRRAAEGGMATADLLILIRDGVGLGGAMSLLDASKGGEGSSHLDDLEALEQVAGLHRDPATFEGWLRSRFDRQSDPGGVTLSTVHRVKGMEWDAVIVYGATAGILPHRLADDIEEERRVLHVAITRGRERVEVLADRARPSPFLAELDGRAPRQALPPTGGDPVAAAAARRASAGPVDRARRERAPLPDLPPEAAELEEALKAWRRERARADKVSAFIICSDRTLRAIASGRPASLAALRSIDGIGPTKLEAYGEELLALIGAGAEARA
ncbi:MAG: ATP-dependent DNA helicase UvrD2 [Actinomycetota bacterium]|nr:ATP-dependent DNA helicase UvrD2 [Actinomycetota bacterium]